MIEKGTIINNRYELREYIGSGTFGEVWLAQDTRTGISVALKIYIALTTNAAEFLKEYQTAYGLRHTNLLTADYFDIWERRPFLIMKYCPNGSLAGRVKQMSERDMWTFLRDVASGLEFLHSQKPDPIVHQDIKPDNILVDEQGRYLITDFGISKRIRSSLRKMSTTNTSAGSVPYMAPERFSAEPTPVKASDIWSLGATIYELATGDLPFSGMGGGMQTAGAERPNLPAEYSSALNDTMRACLEKETKSSYDEDNSVTHDDSSFGDISGNAKYDAARANWGSAWRLPTDAEFEELIYKCTWQWTTVDGHNGYRVTSKKNGNSIFLPAAGRRDGSSLYYAGGWGYYWSSSPYESFSDYAYDLYFDSSRHYVDWSRRYNGESVRPVSE